MRARGSDGEKAKESETEIKVDRENRWRLARDRQIDVQELRTLKIEKKVTPRVGKRVEKKGEGSKI